MKKTPRIKNLETPYKDIHGRIIKVGDIIIFGFLGQHWKVSQAKRKSKYVEKGEYLITIVSDDSGKGYQETMKDCGIEIPDNQTEVCTEGCYSTLTSA